MKQPAPPKADDAEKERARHRLEAVQQRIRKLEQNPRIQYLTAERDVRER